MTGFKILNASTLFAAAFALALGLSAVPSDSYACNTGVKHNSGEPCGGGGEFTAELTAGAFVFGPLSSVEVTPNSRENTLRSNTDLDMVRPNDSGDLDGTWDQVFNTCGELLEENSVDSFFVGDDNWTIEKPGGVRVIFRDIVLQDAEVTVQLIGDEFEFLGDPFLPNSGETSVFILTKGLIWGNSVKGVHPRRGCQPPGGGGADEFDLIVPSTLEITAN